MKSEKEQVLQSAINGAFVDRTKLNINRASTNKIDFQPKETPTNVDRKDLSTAFGAKPTFPKNAAAKKSMKENPALATLDVAKMKDATKPEFKIQESIPEKSSAETKASEDKKKSDVPIGPSTNAQASEAVPAKTAV